MRTKTRTRKTIWANPDPNRDSGSFYFALMRVAVGQICKENGFKSTTELSLVALTRISALYLQTLSRAAAAYSNVSGRGDSNLFDVANAIYDLVGSNNVDCFPGMGSSTIGNNSHGVLRTFIQFVESRKEMPFAKPIPKRCRLVEAPPRRSEKQGPSHVPMWLPAFPEVGAQPADAVSCSTRYGLNLWGDRSNQHTRVDKETEEEFDLNQRLARTEDARGGGDLPSDRNKLKFNFRLQKRSIT